MKKLYCILFLNDAAGRGRFVYNKPTDLKEETAGEEAEKGGDKKKGDKGQGDRGQAILDAAQRMLKKAEATERKGAWEKLRNNLARKLMRSAFGQHSRRFQAIMETYKKITEDDGYFSSQNGFQKAGEEMVRRIYAEARGDMSDVRWDQVTGNDPQLKVIFNPDTIAIGTIRGAGALYKEKSRMRRYAEVAANNYRKAATQEEKTAIQKETAELAAAIENWSKGKAYIEKVAGQYAVTYPADATDFKQAAQIHIQECQLAATKRTNNADASPSREEMRRTVFNFLDEVAKLERTQKANRPVPAVAKKTAPTESKPESAAEKARREAVLVYVTKVADGDPQSDHGRALTQANVDAIKDLGTNALAQVEQDPSKLDAAATQLAIEVNKMIAAAPEANLATAAVAAEDAAGSARAEQSAGEPQTPVEAPASADGKKGETVAAKPRKMSDERRLAVTAKLLGVDEKKVREIAGVKPDASAADVATAFKIAQGEMWDKLTPEERKGLKAKTREKFVDGIMGDDTKLALAIATEKHKDTPMHLQSMLARLGGDAPKAKAVDLAATDPGAPVLSEEKVKQEDDIARLRRLEEAAHPLVGKEVPLKKTHKFKTREGEVVTLKAGDKVAVKDLIDAKRNKVEVTPARHADMNKTWIVDASLIDFDSKEVTDIVDNFYTRNPLALAELKGKWAAQDIIAAKNDTLTPVPEKKKLAENQIVDAENPPV